MLYSRLAIACFMCFLSVFLQGCDKHAQDRAAINMVMEKLGTAVESRDGPMYAQMIAADNIEYDTRTLKTALTGKKADIMALSFSQRYEILLVRLIGNKKELKELDGKGYVAWAVTNGIYEYMPGPNADLELGGLTFRGDEAYCDLVIKTETDVRLGRRRGSVTITDEKPTPYTLRFALEGGQWKFDRTTFISALNIQIQAEIVQAGVNEDNVLLGMLKENTGEQIPANIWTGMLR